MGSEGCISSQDSIVATSEGASAVRGTKVASPVAVFMSTSSVLTEAVLPQPYSMINRESNKNNNLFLLCIFISSFVYFKISIIFQIYYKWITGIAQCFFM